MNLAIHTLRQDMNLILKAALRSSVAKNAGSLYVIQIANYVVPLITVPYLVRVLGPAGYGTVAFGQSLTAYFTLFVDYGFALSATRKISVNRGDQVAISRTVFNVWAAKMLFCIAGMVVLLVLVSLVPKLHDMAALLFVLYGSVLGNTLFPVWLYQGMEKMVAISVINLVMRLLVVIGIFTIIHQPDDYLLYAGLTSLGAVAAGVAGVVVAFHMFKLRPALPSWRGIWEEMAGGWTLFLSQASVSLYTVGNAFILGLLTNNTVVGYYSAAEKIVKAIVGMLSPVSQAAYPRFSKMASESKALALQWGRRMLFFMGGIGLILSVALFAGAPMIVRIVLGPGYEPSIMVIRVLAALPLLIGVSNILGIQLMLPFGKDKKFTAILFSAGLINIVLALILAPLLEATGMALSVLTSEVFVTSAMLTTLSLDNLNPLIGRHLSGKP
ncbi:MAG: flippase [Clostridia bacterium]|nr:MAG: flippase [Clostridia bacterium]